MYIIIRVFYCFFFSDFHQGSLNPAARLPPKGRSLFLLSGGGGAKRDLLFCLENGQSGKAYLRTVKRHG